MSVLLCVFQPFEGHELEKIGSVVGGAVITSNGKLTPSFEYIAKLREAQQKSALKGDFSSEKKVVITMIMMLLFNYIILCVDLPTKSAMYYYTQVLVLGAGYVSAPAIDYLTQDSSVGVTVAAVLKAEADKLAMRYLICCWHHKLF